MLPQLPFSLSSAAAYLSAVAAVPVSSSTASSISLDEYFGHLIPVTNDVIFNQLSGPETGSDPGVVLLVIPVPEHPEWETFYIRDNCLMYNSWLNELATFGDESQYLRPFIDDAVHALLRSQHVPSISGNIFTGGLEEVAFDKHIGKLLDPSARVGSPAADGPPFRAAMLVKYAEWLLESKQNNGTWVADVLWPAIDLDLQWVSLDWNESSWDLWWPPVWGGSYWTASLQYRALYAGAQLSRKIGRVESTADYQSRAALILDYMQTFWNEDEEFMAETTVTDVSTGGRSGYGVAPLTVSVLNFDPTLGCDSKTFQPCSDRALSSLKVIDDAFKQLLPINAGDQPVLLGFFLEEEMFSGHPQFFSTFSAAEQLLDALVTWI
ncbi:Six-hairpin glycosidase-like protein [Gloeopeniophorella convolvens]|nr:Six-hairpin glycosidase-like protein [Gloeopeniophorella convolvens]